MPPIIALSLCAAFVLVLLRAERKQSPNVSPVSWLPTVWMISCASKPLAAWTGASGGSVEGGSPLDRDFTTLLIVAGLAVISSRRFDWRLLRGNQWLIVIYVFALVSIAWSDAPFVSLKRYIRFSGSMIMAVVVMSEKDPAQGVECVLRRMAFILIPLSLVLIKYFPPLGVAYGKYSGELMWVGVADQKNGLGIICFVSAFYLFWRLIRAWDTNKSAKCGMAYDGVILVMALYLLKGPPRAYSATSISVFALGVGTLLLFRHLSARGKGVRRAAFVAFALVLFTYGFGAPFGLRSVGSGLLELIGRNATFTDRDEIWGELLKMLSGHFVLGYGYGGFWLTTVSDVNEAHNGYLSVMLDLGWVGVLLLLLFIVHSCRAAHAALSQQFWPGALGCCFLLMIVLHNTSEASFFRTSDVLWSLIVLFSLLVEKLSAERAATHLALTEDAIDEQANEGSEDPLSISSRTA